MSATVDPRSARRQPDPKECQRLAEQMLAYAKRAGADGAEVLVRDGTELEVKVRLGEPELVKEAGSRALGLRVLRDHRAAVTYTSDFALSEGTWTCGKDGQSVPVGIGTPTMKIAEITVGGTKR